MQLWMDYTVTIAYAINYLCYLEIFPGQTGGEGVFSPYKQGFLYSHVNNATFFISINRLITVKYIAI